MVPFTVVPRAPYLATSRRTNPSTLPVACCRYALFLPWLSTAAQNART
jgi:hypothetical protein